MANVSLTPQLEEFMKEKVQSGRYSSVSEVMREPLRLLAEREEERERKLEALRAEIAKGLEDSRNGRVMPAVGAIETIKREGREWLCTHHGS